MEKLTKKQKISNLKDGDRVDDIFVVKIKKSVAPYSKGFYFALLLSDNSGGNIEYRYWGSEDEDEIKELFKTIKEDSIIKITGKVSSYRKKLQISSGLLCELKILEIGEYEADFIKVSKKDIEEMYKTLLSKINSVENQELKKLLLNIFDEVGEKFKNHAGAISIHHNWRGGLLEHTLEVVGYCERSVEFFSELNRDLLLTGAILHDVGKIEELELTTRVKGSQKGQFVGHLVLGLNFVSRKLEEIEIDETTKNQILHLLVSHHGRLEYGSPKEPMTLEAVALYYADELSSKISEMLNIIEENKDNTEDDFFYSYRKRINIFLRGDKKMTEEIIKIKMEEQKNE